MNGLIDVAISKTFLLLARLYNSAPQLDMRLEDVVNDYVGFHPLHARLQRELRVGLRQCDRCNFHCAIETGKYGRCHGVANVGTGLVETNYGLIADITPRTTDCHDLFHFKPNSRVLGIGGLFCNFGCSFCMNALLTHVRSMNVKILDTIVKYHLEPSEVIDMAKKADAKGIGFTLNEPTMNLGFILDAAPLARQVGLFVAIQTNGYMTAKTIELLAPNVDAVAVGMKGFGDGAVYDKYTLEVRPQHVLDTIRQFHARGAHVEITSLTFKSDNVETATKQSAEWLAYYVGTEIPVHIFKAKSFPWMSWAESDEVTNDHVEAVAQVCRAAGLVNVYNHEMHDVSTYCPNCGSVLVERTMRDAATISHTNTESLCDTRCAGLEVVDGKGRCAACGTQIHGKW